MSIRFAGLVRSLIATVAFASVASGARADVVATFIGNNPFENANTTATKGGPSVTYDNLPLGPFNFVKISDGGLGLPDLFKGFCADYFQGVSQGTTYTYTVVDVLDLPDVGGSATKLALLQKLFDGFYDTTDTGGTGGAFQLAVWKILYDGGSVTSLTNGNFTAVGDANNTSIAIAEGWLNSITDPNVPVPASKYELIGLLSPTAQDQIVVKANSVPAPAGLVLVLIGGAALYARRRFSGAKVETEPKAEEIV